MIAISLLALAHAFDFASFLVMVARRGFGTEANPVVRQIATHTGLEGITIAKVATVVLAASIVVILSRNHKVMAGVLLVFAIAAGVVGGLSNIATM
jgi:hypothetical protein